MGQIVEKKQRLVEGGAERSGHELPPRPSVEFPLNVTNRLTRRIRLQARDQSDSATLIVEIGKSPAVVQANAQRVVPGPDGTVVLPAGVQLSDVRVVGRNLVIDLPGGGQMVIVDGAIFVPRLVFGDVEVPATSLAALLIGSEIRPAAGSELAGNTQSGGGNFALPVAPLDPGIELGDLIPPTELAYVPPEFREPLLIEDDDEPEILIQTPTSRPGPSMRPRSQ